MIRIHDWTRLVVTSSIALAAGVLAIAPALGKDLVIAVEYGALFFPFQSGIKKALDRHAKELGGITIIEGDSAQNARKELDNVENFILRKPDCILLIPVDFKSPAAACFSL